MLGVALVRFFALLVRDRRGGQVAEDAPGDRAHGFGLVDHDRADRDLFAVLAHFPSLGRWWVWV